MHKYNDLLELKYKNIRMLLSSSSFFLNGKQTNFYALPMHTHFLWILFTFRRQWNGQFWLNKQPSLNE